MRNTRVFFASFFLILWICQIEAYVYRCALFGVRGRTDRCSRYGKKGRGEILAYFYIPPSRNLRFSIVIWWNNGILQLLSTHSMGIPSLNAETLSPSRNRMFSGFLKPEVVHIDILSSPSERYRPQGHPHQACFTVLPRVPVTALQKPLPTKFRVKFFC